MFEILKKLVSRFLSKELSLCQIQSQLSQPINKNVRINNSRMLVASDKNNFTPAYEENIFISVGMMGICMCMRAGTLHRIISSVCV